jgi:hypothetical protein
VTSCSALSPTNFFHLFIPHGNHSASEAPTPTRGGDAFDKELAKRSQDWLIEVESHLRGATIGGESSASCK